MKEKIQKLIERMIPFCSSWIQKLDDGLTYFVDPNDREEISAHYGATHAAASFIILGKLFGNDRIYQKGLELLHSILDRWEISMTLPAFHFDFNNFAISIVEPFVDEKTSSLIRDIVCKTDDSRHNTVNWLPMRWVVNRKRVEWTGNKKYQDVIDLCRKIISDATNADGGIEDRLPHGMSFNLQYDLATVAVLQYLRVHGENINLNKELGFLINAIAPDGDINYQGRGTNQIFAWGLWIYLLSSSGQLNELEKALSFLDLRLQKMLENNSIMLNEWHGKDKYLWWDYHYASVYTAHCLFWLILGYIDKDMAPILPLAPTSSETGFHIYRSENFFVSWFEGRSEYLAERGPSITAIWTKKQGMICKGTFAPWQGSFGNKYIYEDIVLKNYCGLIEIELNKDWSKNQYVHKLLPNIETDIACTLKPIFCPISVMEKDETLEIIWSVNNSSKLMFNMPALSESCRMQLFADGKESSFFCNSAIKNQYAWVYLNQSRSMRVKKIKLVLE